MEIIKKELLELKEKYGDERRTSIEDSEDGEMATKTIPDVYYFDYPYDSINFVSVSAINIKNNNAEVKSSAYLLSQAENVYVSEKNIYLTYTRYVSEQDLQM